MRMKRRKERMLDKARLAREERSTTVNRKLTNGSAITSTHGAVAYVELQPGVNIENVVSNPTHLVAPLASRTHIIRETRTELQSQLRSFDRFRSFVLLGKGAKEKEKGAKRKTCELKSKV